MYMFLSNNLMWLWLAVFVICILVEAATFALTAVWGAISALVMVFLCKTVLPFGWQAVIFLVLTIVLVLTTRPFAVKKLKIGRFKTNIESMEGQKVVVTKSIGKFEKGEVKTESGIIWAAKSSDDSEIPAGETCRIVEVKGNTLYIV